MSDLYIGLMSGTSIDGIDAVLVDFSSDNPQLLKTLYSPYSETIRKQILALCTPDHNEIERMGECDHVLGKLFAQAVQALLKKANKTSAEIKAIGSHGQTIRHQPDLATRFTLQIGDPNIITAETGITTIADFRRRDMAHGGQGAPLVPAFHQQIFSSSTKNRAIINIGGIANVTLLPKSKSSLIGCDIGPGNTLLDAWINRHQQRHHDHDGTWAAIGVIHEGLLQALLKDPFFVLPPPKSTGREYFNLMWLEKHLQKIDENISAVDIQTTLTELTARIIITAIAQHFPEGELLICGGGARNTYLMTRLQTLAKPAFSISSTEMYGIHPDWVEAMAFAWLAKQTLYRKPGNLPSVTGASIATILGGIYFQ